MREAVAEIAKGVQSNGRNSARTTPTRIESCIHALRVVSSIAQSPKDETVARHLRRLGKEMVAPSEDAGREAIKNGQIRLDLSIRELLVIRWLAHAGFKLMMRNKTDDKFSFRDEDEKDAQESNFAIDRLEWRISQEHKDPSAPYALALCRQKLIWERWPSSAVPPDAQNAA